VNDELPPSVNAAAGTGASASETLGDSIEVALEDDSVPTPIAPPTRANPASYSLSGGGGNSSGATPSGARARLRDVDDDTAPASRRVRPRMTLRIPDDEVARPLSAPPPEASPPSRPEIAPPRPERPPAPPRRSDVGSSRPPPPSMRSEIPPRSTEASAQRIEIAPQRIITINPPSNSHLLAEWRSGAGAALADSPSKSADVERGPRSSTPPDTEPIPSNELTLEESSELEVVPIVDIELAPLPHELGPLPPPPAPPMPPAPPAPPGESPEGASDGRRAERHLAHQTAGMEPVVVSDVAEARSSLLTVPDSDGGVDIPVVEDEEFARPSAPELAPEDLVSIESEPTVATSSNVTIPDRGEQARPRVPPPPPAAPPPPPPGSTPTPIAVLERAAVARGEAPSPSPSAPPVAPAAAAAVKPSYPPEPNSVRGAAPPARDASSGPANALPHGPVMPAGGMSSTPDLGSFSGLASSDERPIADAPFVIGPAQSELAPPPLSDATVPQRKRTRPWWEELFNDDFIRTMAKVTDAQIAAEADFIEDSLAVAKGAMVLDLACGTGRHAIELTQRGYQVVGYDLSLSMLARAADEAQDRNQKLNFVQGDMREMTFEETFDGIYSWNTSFGFFDEDRNAQVIARVHRALRKGGQFLLDVVNRDFIGRQAPSLAWFEGEGCVCMDEMTIDWITSRMRTKRTMMMDDGRSKEIEYSIRIYSLHELGKMLHDHGFRVAEVSGRTATPGVFFGTDSPRTLILAEKRA